MTGIHSHRRNLGHVEFIPLSLVNLPFSACCSLRLCGEALLYNHFPNPKEPE
jgi:hypothetical protein